MKISKMSFPELYLLYQKVSFYENFTRHYYKNSLFRKSFLIFLADLKSTPKI